MLYPLRFHPIFKERLWGGQELRRLYGKSLPPGKAVGEAWEISDRPGDVSVIANGPFAGRDLHWLMQQHREALLGEAVAPRGRFPLLVKILDAREILSVQVHPPAAVAPQLGGEPKTELWYVTHTRPGARLSAGLKAGVSREHFERCLRDGTVAECIHEVPVEAGDDMFLPSGRVHALGADMVIFEIQENSDTTYRVFDWNRVGPDGRPRELHVEAALASIDFADAEPALVTSPWQVEDDGHVRRRRLVEHSLFTVDEFRVAQRSRRSGEGGGVKILGVVSGALRVDHPVDGGGFELSPGDFALIPAQPGGGELSFAPGTIYLEARPGSGG